MSHLTSEELITGYDALMASVFGSEQYKWWKIMKTKVQMYSEGAFVEWLLTLAESELKKDPSAPIANVTASPLDKSAKTRRTQSKAKVSPPAKVTMPVFPCQSSDNIVKLESHLESDICADVEESDLGYSMEGEENTNSSDIKEAEVDHQPSADPFYGAQQQLVEVDTSGGIKNHMLDKHVEQRVFDDRLNFICTVCGGVYSGLATVRRHIRTVHFSDKRFQCDVCMKKFKHGFTLTRHKLRVCSNEEKS